MTTFFKHLGAIYIFLLAAALSACSNDLLADAVDSAYISGDGSVIEYKKDQRVDIPSFSAELDTGELIDQSYIEGTITVVNFWYAACQPCRNEASDLKELYDEFSKSHVQFLGVNVRDSKETAASFEKNFGIEYPSVLDAKANNTLQLAFNSAGIAAAAIPLTIFISADGKIASVISGQLNYSIASSLIKTLIEESGSD